MFCTLNGIVNFYSVFAASSFFLFFFLYFFSGYSSSLDFFDWSTYSPFSFFHSESAANLAVTSAWFTLISFFSSTGFVSSDLRLFR